MTSLKSPQDQVAFFGGEFFYNGTKKSHKDLAEVLGVKTDKNIRKCTVVIATQNSYETNKSIRENKDRNLPFLNETWAYACMGAGKWIEPSRDHFHYHPEPAPPGATSTGSTSHPESVPPGETCTMSTRQSTPDTIMSDLFDGSAGSSTRDTTPGNQGAKDDRTVHRQATSTDNPVTPSQTQEKTPAAPSRISEHSHPQAIQSPSPARIPEQDPASHEVNPEHLTIQADRTHSQPSSSTLGQAYEQTPTHTRQDSAQPQQTQVEPERAQAQPSSPTSSLREQWYSDAGIVHKIVLPIHPADKYKAREDQRRNVELNIDFSFRHFLWISDPETQFPEHKIQGKTKKDLRASWIIPMKDSGIQGQQYRDVGRTLATSTEKAINDCKMEDFDWWGTATDGRVCYNAGVLPGESKPRVWARTTIKKKWKDIDTEISRIRMIFAQPSLAEEKELSQNGREKSVILENLRECERYLEAEKNSC
ncbi:hypothetical protein HIM_09204 [Hirsutella minnesotensis 3608]|uniref:BRCT domain-containing protein n=1 Tax=Hirsutella minnesotensis 3608 TaxID=1043627 RepID=A0A0F7ZGS8_9HYPO|nr:hypothetical protein HIM_09204 [Hirsutella minnesotensis 3608]